jgi:putrescine aminotransferase
VWDGDGTRFLDFVSGYAALNLGHNHPRVREALDRVAEWPNLMEGLDGLSGALAHNLTELAGGELRRACFANSGAEVVDMSIKLARAATRRAALVACRGSFHGRTIGALSVASRDEFREPFAPLLPATFVPYGDAGALEEALRRRDVAGFLVEPIQGEGGIVVPPAGYLQAARELCTRYGTLLIADEIQTGLGRTGHMFAVAEAGVVPDALLLGKSLGGGLMPISAILARDPVWREAGGGTPRSPFQFPTFGGNPRACAAALATLEVLQADRLVERAAELGRHLLDRLQELRRRQPLIADVRGRGLMVGIEFAPATRGLGSAVTGNALNRLSHDFLSGLVVMKLRQERRILTLSTLNDPNVLRAQPPLTIERGDADTFVDGLDHVLRGIRSLPHALLGNWRVLQKALRA